MIVLEADEPDMLGDAAESVRFPLIVRLVSVPSDVTFGCDAVDNVIAWLALHVGEPETVALANASVLAPTVSVPPIVKLVSVPTLVRLLAVTPEASVVPVSEPAGALPLMLTA